jgi:tetratricopeptide (TPR) repeat protein
VPISANGGINLYIGNAPGSDRLVAIRPGAAWEALASEPERVAGITSSGGRDAWFARRAASACTGDLFGCVWHLGEKARQLLASREIPRNESLDVIERDAVVLRALTPSFGPAVVPYVLLLPLAVAGAVVALRRGKRTDHLVALSLLYLAAATILFFVTGRYRIQLVPELAVLGAVGAHALLGDPANRRGAAMAAAVALGLAVWPLRLPVDDVPFEAEMHYVIGGRRARLGDDAGAVTAWPKAVSLEPGYLEAGFNLGLAFERLGRPDAAAAAYRDVLARHPDDLASAARLRRLGEWRVRR